MIATFAQIYAHKTGVRVVYSEHMTKIILRSSFKKSN